MSDQELRTKEDVSTCADDEAHDWEYIRDWIGDPGVINGTMNIYYKRCRQCGKDGEWDGHGSEDDDDPDRAYEQARDDATHWEELFYE